MGTNTLSTRATSNTVQAADVNQFVTAMVGDLVPRDGTYGPVSSAGSIGSTTYPWTNGYFNGSTGVRVYYPSSAAYYSQLDCHDGNTYLTAYGTSADLYILTNGSGAIRITNTTDTTSVSTGSMYTLGGFSAAKAIYAGTMLYLGANIRIRDNGSGVLIAEFYSGGNWTDKVIVLGDPNL